MTKIPRISIVTPSLNQAAYLGEAIDSVASQRDTEVEHIIVDGASTDGTVEILRAQPTRPGLEHLRWISEPDNGQSDAINKGFRTAKGDIIGWLNADDRYLPGAFAAVRDYFAAHPNIDLVYGDSRWIAQDGRVLKVRREMSYSSFVVTHHRVLYIPTTTTFFRRRIIDEGELLRDDFHYAMDHEWYMRLGRKGYRIGHLPKVLADFRWHDESKSSMHHARQYEERDRAVLLHSRVLRTLPKGRWRETVTTALRLGAAVRRYPEKLVRGAYF